MSKDILYKAKRVDNDEWVCGLPIYKNYIRVFTEHEYEDEDGIKVKYSTTQDCKIDPKTMCEFTGLIDKNKNKIFEHDILTVYNSNYSINFEDGGFTVGKSKIPLSLCFATEENYVVIGNIFDNPELLEEE